VKLLYEKNISDYAIEDLLGRKVKLKSSSVISDRYKKVTDIEWVIDTPNRINAVGKFTHKLHTVNRGVGNQHRLLNAVGTDFVDKIFMGFMISVSSLMLGMGYMIPLVLIMNLVNYTPSSSVLIAITSTLVILTPRFLRVANNIRIQYKKYMNKDALKK